MRYRLLLIFAIVLAAIGISSCGSNLHSVTKPEIVHHTKRFGTSPTIVVGNLLTASNGTWSGTVTSYTYQWQDCNSSGASCTNISGATNQIYTVQSSDQGYTIEVVVTAHNTGGTASQSSAATNVIPGGSSGTCSGSELCVQLPDTSTVFGTGLGTQDSYGFTAQMTPASGISVYSRLQTLNPTAWRILGNSSYNDEFTSQISPINYYTVSSGSNLLNAWDFRSLDEQLSEAPASTPKEIAEEIPAPLYTCVTGSWTASGGCTSVGALTDQTYATAATFYADLTKYYETGSLLTNSGSAVSYTSTTLTDTANTFTGDSGDCLTATVINANGFPDWVTGTITSVSGHVATLSAGWSTAESYGTLAGISIASSTPASGAAYNLASCTAPGDLAGGTGASAANPWPLPPSVGTVGYIEIGNEPDLSNTNLPGTTPSVNIPAAPTLTAVHSSSGILTGGSTYSYELESDGVQAGGVYCGSTSNNLCQGWSTPGTAASITLPSGATACSSSTCNTVQITWSVPAANEGALPYGYGIYGRTTSSYLGIADVGRNASGCPSACSFIDTGVITPSGAVNTVNDATGGGNVITPGVYVQEWNVIAPAIRAVDSGMGLNGPTEANTSGYGMPSVDVNCVTTTGLTSACANGDGGYSISTDYIPTLIKYATTTPTIITFHGYGTACCDTPESNNFASISSYEIANYDSTDKTVIDNAGLPVWIDENNYNASGAATNSYRSETQVGSAWLATNYILWAQADPGVIKNMIQWAANSNDPSYQLFATSTLSGNSSCIPQPACQNLTTSVPNLEFWTLTELNSLLSGGGHLVTVSNVPTGFEATAVQTDSTHVVLILVNIAQGSDDGNGASGSVDVQLSGDSVSSAQQITINGSTSMSSGPSTNSLGAVSNINLSPAGYEVDLIKFTI